MLTLAVNTVGDACEAALSGPDLNLSVGEPMVRGHDVRLAPLVDNLLRKAEIAPGRLERIAVVTGPGSFTGVRVGVAFARGLALALEIPVFGYTSLEALDIDPETRRERAILGLLPARRRPPDRSWWSQLVVQGAGAGEPVEADAGGLGALIEQADMIAGADLEDVAAILGGRPQLFAKPCAMTAARLAGAETGERNARPVYVRAPDAAPFVRPR